MTDAEKVVKALRDSVQYLGYDSPPRRRVLALADFVEAATNTREYLGLGGGLTTQCMAKEQDAALARLAEVMS